MIKIILRDEYKRFERRTPLVPADAKRLLDAGFDLQVERSKDRIFLDQAYADVGAPLVDSETWRSADDQAIVLGLKELPEDQAFPLIHRHIHFAHVFKNQTGWKSFLKRFEAKGHLWDLEYLTKENGRRVAAFGYWAGYAGAAVGIKAWAASQRGEELQHLHPYEDRASLLKSLKADLESGLQAAGRSSSKEVRAIVMGALGRCGLGGRDLFEELGVSVTGWDRNNTKGGGPFAEILEYDLLLNAVLVKGEMPPFLTREMLASNERLTSIADVSCDPNGPYNPLPIYTEGTTFDRPTIRIRESLKQRLDLIAIDHLPTLLPKESSEDYSSQLVPHLLNLDQPESDGVWKRAKELFSVKRADAV